jgi:hypothetical protein
LLIELLKVNKRALLAHQQITGGSRLSAWRSQRTMQRHSFQRGEYRSWMIVNVRARSTQKEQNASEPARAAARAQEECHGKYLHLEEVALANGGGNRSRKTYAAGHQAVRVCGASLNQSGASE